MNIQPETCFLDFGNGLVITGNERIDVQAQYIFGDAQQEPILKLRSDKGFKAIFTRSELKRNKSLIRMK